jgi:uncharacterized membrane protein YqaE (UPF0057 family)
MRIAAIIAAILLPPLGVFLVRGMGRDFWIATVLTILFFLPGMFFALFVVGGGSSAAIASRFSRRRAATAQ